MLSTDDYIRKLESQGAFRHEDARIEFEQESTKIDLQPEAEKISKATGRKLYEVWRSSDSSSIILVVL